MAAGTPKGNLCAWSAPLRSSRGFRLVFASRTVTAFGTLAVEVALLIQAKQLTGSPLAVGLLGVAELVPLVVFGLYGGVLADRFDRRTLMRWGEAGLACCAVLLTVNARLPHPALWPLYALSAVISAVSALQRPSFDASVPRLVPREQLTAAAALLSMSQNASFLLGSAFGGVLAVTPGPWLVYGLDAASLVGFGLSPDLYLALGFLVAAGAADMVSGIFRATLWNQTTPDALRGRLAGVELLSYSVGPTVGQLRSGAVAGAVSTRFSLVSGGLLCVGAVAAVCALLPGLIRYRAVTVRAARLPPGTPAADGSPCRSPRSASAAGSDGGPAGAGAAPSRLLAGG